jgi:cytochrome c-type biogenesis protein CcmH
MLKHRLAGYTLAVLWMASGQAFAVQPDEVLQDIKLEKRARALSTELRCLVCQNQSIDDSNAPLARDLRILVRERLTAGDSDTQAMAFIVARYGEFVLLRPPFDARTLLLWLSPFALLAVGGIALASRSRRTAFQISEPLSEAEQQALTLALSEPEESMTGRSAPLSKPHS